MNKLKTYLGLSLTVLMTGCASFLDPYPYGAFPEEELWEHSDVVQGFVGRAYDVMWRDYNNNEGFNLDGATDDAVMTSTTHPMARLGTGAMVPGGDPFKGFWYEDYKGIGSVNRFLDNDNGLNSRYKTDARQNDLVRHRLQGEAYALRAWHYFDLLKRYGGVGADSGELLGVPIITEVIDDVYSTDKNRKRATFEECVEQIKNDCDKAYDFLPIAHRDFLLEEKSDHLVAGGRNWGLMDGITTRAILANLYLMYASPLYNPTNDLSRWEKAAKYAKEVMDFKLEVDNVRGGFNPMNRVDWNNPNFPGIIFTSRFKLNNEDTEKSLYPAGFQGKANIGASQELVDAFPMANGYPKDHPKGAELYDPQNPYANRDPRFYSVIYYNGATINRYNNPSKPMYTFESWNSENESGDDVAGKRKVSRTNYHIKKYVYMGWNRNDANVKKGHHSKFYIRWAHMVLAFAEAANEFEGPNGNSFGLSAKDAMKYLRKRHTYDGAKLYSDEDPYLDEVAQKGKDAFREFVRNERRIETCFEGIRFFDLRRWSTPDDLHLLNGEVTRPEITKEVDGSFTYEYGKVVEKRQFTSPYYPLPYPEIMKMDALEQNAGWDSWK